MNKTYNLILDYVKQQPLADTHEHLGSEKERINIRHGLLDTLHYVHCDLFSTGMPPKQSTILNNNKLPFKERWAAFSPYWPAVKNTAYGRAFQLGLKLVHGFKDLNDNNAADIDARIQTWPCQGCYDTWFTKTGIKWIINNRNEMPADGKHIYRSFNITPILNKPGIEAINWTNNLSNIEITNFTDWKKAISYIIEEQIKNDFAVALKIPIAYQRTLDFGEQPPSNTDKIVDLILNKKPLTDNNYHQLSNAFAHFACEIAAEMNLPLQIHAGIQAGGFNTLDNAHPGHLNKLFMRYRSTKFDIFHCGYPWGLELGTLSKMFPNVFVDMAWTHIISPESSQQWIREWIDLLPINKVLGFGGDHFFIEGTVAHAEIARQNIARALASKVDNGSISLNTAKEFADHMMYKNAEKLFVNHIK